MSEKYQSGTVETRRHQSNQDKQALFAHYHQCWDVENIADIEENREELSQTDGRSIAQLLECADIDTIIDTHDKQIAVQEKMVYSDSGDSLSIRIENNTADISPEGERLKLSHTDSTVLTPTVLVFAKIDSGIEWVRMINVRSFVADWNAGGLQPDTVYSGPKINTKLFFSPSTIDESGTVFYNSLKGGRT